MAEVRISDVIVPEIFTPYMQRLTEEKSRLIRQHKPPKKHEGGNVIEYEILRLHDVIQTRDIGSAEELDDALAELRQAVENALDAGKRVVLG